MVQVRASDEGHFELVSNDCELARFGVPVIVNLSCNIVAVDGKRNEEVIVVNVDRCGLI